jgi:uncharacterized membrane protein YfcA
VVPEQALKLMFAAFMVLVALQFLRRFLQSRKGTEQEGSPGAAE